MDASTIDTGLVGFEQMLADEWAITRSDIYKARIRADAADQCGSAD